MKTLVVRHHITRKDGLCRKILWSEKQKMLYSVRCMPAFTSWRYLISLCHHFFQYFFLRYVFSTVIFWTICDDSTNFRRALTSPIGVALVHRYSSHLTWDTILWGLGDQKAAWDRPSRILETSAIRKVVSKFDRTDSFAWCVSILLFALRSWGLVWASAAGAFWPMGFKPLPVRALRSLVSESRDTIHDCCLIWVIFLWESG